jgi:flagellar protein FliJ
MTSNKSPIKTLLELAHSRVEEATRQLGELIASEQACEVKLQMLQQYRAEYRERFLQTARNGIDPNAWRNFSSFLAKLDDAINSQQGMVSNSKSATLNGQQKWVSENTRAKAFDTLHHRQLIQEVKRQNKQEQRQTDEHAIKNYLRHSEEDGS